MSMLMNYKCTGRRPVAVDVSGFHCIYIYIYIYVQLNTIKYYRCIYIQYM